MKIYNSILICYKNLIVFFLSVLLLAGLSGDANAQHQLEYKIKAAFLYNFAKFVEWPNLKDLDPSLPFIVGVLGDDPFGPELEAIRKKNIRGRRILIKHFETIDDVFACHILFISFKDSNLVKEALKKIREKQILTIGETEGFAKSGGTIGFVEKQNKIHFEINRKSAASVGLSISSKLLKLAIIVETEEGNDLL